MIITADLRTPLVLEAVDQVGIDVMSSITRITIASRYATHWNVGQQLSSAAQGTTHVHCYTYTEQVKTTITNLNDASRLVQDNNSNEAKYCLIVKPE